MNQVPRGRSQLLLLAALFFGPLLAALLLYFALPGLQPHARTNYGELINPARPLPDQPLVDADGKTHGHDALHGHWSYVYLGAASCDEACADKLYQIRQIRLLLNEKRLRVQRIYLAPDAAALPALRTQLAETHPDLKFYAETGDTRLLQALFGRVGAEREALYLIDPLGNWLMVYPAAADSPGILKDIKKLLRISQIG